MKDVTIKLLQNAKGFNWDKGNEDKSLKKHNVSIQEVEQVFFNQPHVLFEDQTHSQQEHRYGILGTTNEERELSIFFTIRDEKIRPISARDINRGKELRKLKIEKEAA